MLLAFTVKCQVCGKLFCLCDKYDNHVLQIRKKPRVMESCPGGAQAVGLVRSDLKEHLPIYLDIWGRNVAVDGGSTTALGIGAHVVPGMQRTGPRNALVGQPS